MPSVKDYLKNKIAEAAPPKLDLNNVSPERQEQFAKLRESYEDLKVKMSNASAKYEVLGDKSKKPEIAQMRNESAELRRQMRDMKRADPELAKMEPPSVNRMLSNLKASGARLVKSALGIKSNAENAAAADDMINFMARKNERAGKMISDLQEERNKLTAKIEDLTKEMVNAPSDNDRNAAMHEIGRRKADVDVIDAKIAGHEANIKMANDEIVHFEVEKSVALGKAVGGLDYAMDVNRTMTQTDESQLRKLNAEKQQLETEMAEFQTALEVAPEGEKKHLQNRIDLRKEDIGKLDDKIKVQEKNITDNKAMLKDLEHERERKLEVPKAGLKH